MEAVQRLCHAAAFLIAHMGTVHRLFCVAAAGNVRLIIITVLRMLMNAFRNFFVALVRVFMSAGRTRVPPGISALFGMGRVMFTQPGRAGWRTSLNR